MSQIPLYFIWLMTILHCFVQGRFDEAVAECYLNRKGTIGIMNCPNLVNDPEFKNQWTLVSRPFAEFRNRTTIDLGVLDVWIKHEIFGQHVTIAVNDDGVEATHPELRSRINTAASYNYFYNVSDGTATPDSHHATKVAGIVAMKMNNGICGVGVAPNATIISNIVHIDNRVSPTMVNIEAQALADKNADITINSYNPFTSEKLVIPYLFCFLLQLSMWKGRNGLGTLHVFGAGNVKLDGKTCSFDIYNQEMFTISVASITPWGEPTVYSARCSAIMVAAPSSPADEFYFVTTANGGKCTTYFSGTSASTPLAAGILALGVNTNPGMTLRDWHHALIYTSSHEDLPSQTRSMFKRNGAGFYVSLDFGFGLMNALRLVETAMFFRRVPRMQVCEVPFPVNRAFFSPSHPYRGSIYTDACLDIPNKQVYYLEHVQLRMDLIYYGVQELEIELISPMGTRTKILEAQVIPARSNESMEHDWKFDSVHTWGECAIGNWELIVQDKSPLNVSGVIRYLNLTLYGTVEKPKHYTHEV